MRTWPAPFMTAALAGGLLIGASGALAHGEDKPGPHGGEIRMPGRFHTEVVQVDARTFRVFLLDLSNGDPVVDRSQVELRHQSSVGAAAKVAAECKVSEGDRRAFECRLPAGSDASSGSLEVSASRRGARGVAAYELPLRYGTPR